MFVTPLEVYTSINPTSFRHNHSPQRLVIAQKEEHAPLLIVENIKDHGVKQRATQFKYTDCQFVTGGQPLYMEQLDQLLTRFSEGYHSAGVFINTRADDDDYEQRNMTKTVLDQLKRRLLELYIMHTNKETTKKISVEYGLIGFSDEYCYNYPKRTRFDNSVANRMKISSILEPVELDDIDQAWDFIESNQEREHPTLFVCHITDNHEFESRFAWIDIPPPKDDASYSASYDEFVNRLKIYFSPEFRGILDHGIYSMSHVLLKYFSGAYLTMVFAHFNEYATYNTGVNLDILRYTSNLRNIKCSVSKNESGIHLLQSKNNELQHELVKQNSMIDQYKEFNSKNIQKLATLNEELESSRAREHKLNLSRYATNATMERLKTTSDLEKADLIHQINDLKIQLVESTVASRSYLLTIDDLELRISSDERLKQWLTQCYTVNAKYIEALELKIKNMEDHTKSQDNNEETLQAALNQNIKKWKDAEELRLKQLADKDNMIKELTKQVDGLTLECEQLLRRNKPTQMPTERKMERLEMKQDKGPRKVRTDLQQQKQQITTDMRNHSKPTTTQSSRTSINDSDLPQQPTLSPEPQSSEPQSSEPQSSEPQSSEPQSSEPQSSSRHHPSSQLHLSSGFQPSPQLHSSSMMPSQPHQLSTSSQKPKYNQPDQKIPNQYGRLAFRGKPKEIKPKPKRNTNPKPTTKIDSILTNTQQERGTHTTPPSIDHGTNQREDNTLKPKTVINVDDTREDNETAHLPSSEKAPMRHETLSPVNRSPSQQKHNVNTVNPSPEANPKPPHSEPRQATLPLPDKRSIDVQPLSPITTNTTTSDKPKSDCIIKRNRVDDSQQKTISTAKAPTSLPKYIDLDRDLDLEPLGNGESDDDLFISVRPIKQKQVDQPQDNTGAEISNLNKTQQKVAKKEPAKKSPPKPPTNEEIRSMMEVLFPFLPAATRNLPSKIAPTPSNLTTSAQEESSIQKRDSARKRRLIQPQSLTQQKPVQEEPQQPLTQQKPMHEEPLEQERIVPQEEAASQEKRTARKKRRKLRPDRSPMDETQLSPVINGYSAKYFELD